MEGFEVPYTKEDYKREVARELYQPLAVQVRLVVEGVRLDLPRFREVGPFAAEQPGVVALGLNAAQQAIVLDGKLQGAGPSARGAFPHGSDGGGSTGLFFFPSSGPFYLSRDRSILLSGKVYCRCAAGTGSRA